MKSKTFIKVLYFYCFTLASFANAQGTISTYTSQNNKYTVSGWEAVAQTFQPSALNPVLESWESQFTTTSVNTNVGFSIYSWSGTGISGSALFTTNLVWPTTGGNISVGGINVQLNGGSSYAAVFSLPANTASSLTFLSSLPWGDPYAGGNLWTSLNPNASSGWSSAPADDLLFQASFAPVPEPSIQTLELSAIVLIGFIRSRKLLILKKGALKKRHAMSPNARLEPRPVTPAVVAGSNDRRGYGLGGSHRRRGSVAVVVRHHHAP